MSSDSTHGINNDGISNDHLAGALLWSSGAVGDGCSARGDGADGGSEDSQGGLLSSGRAGAVDLAAVLETVRSTMTAVKHGGGRGHGAEEGNGDGGELHVDSFFGRVWVCLFLLISLMQGNRSALELLTSKGSLSIDRFEGVCMFRGAKIQDLAGFEKSESQFRGLEASSSGSSQKSE